MDDYYSDSQPELIHCAYCGEDYAATYKACPFCNTAPNGKKIRVHEGSARHGNRRVRTNTRGGGYGGERSALSIIGIILSVILILAAVVIVIVLAKSALDNRRANTPSTASASSSQAADSSEQAAASSAAASSASSSAAASSASSSAAASSTDPDSQTPDTQDPDTQTPAATSPDSMTLNYEDVTLTLGETLTLKPTVSPESWDGQIVWSSGDGAVATVDQTGAVKYVAAGTCTVTATAGDVTASCVVRCKAADVGTVQNTVLSVSCFGSVGTDFTIKVGDSVPFKGQGGSGTYSWSVADSSIAKVGSDGVCTGVSAGTTTLTLSDGNSSVQVRVRVQNS